MVEHLLCKQGVIGSNPFASIDCVFVCWSCEGLRWMRCGVGLVCSIGPASRTTILLAWAEGVGAH